MNKKVGLSALDRLSKKQEIDNTDKFKNETEKKEQKNVPIKKEESLKSDLIDKKAEDKVNIIKESKKPLEQKINTSNGVKKEENITDQDIEKEKNIIMEFSKPVLQVKGEKEEKNIRRTFYLDKEIVSELDNMSEQTGVSRGIIVKEALKYYFSLVEIKE